MHHSVAIARRRAGRTTLLVAALVLVGLAATPSLALARDPDDGAVPDSPRRAASKTIPGHDVSYPQCGGPFPAPFSFAIVGVNGGRVFSPNPCLGTGSGPSELAWAGPDAALYANTGNPGPELSSFWPHGQTYPLDCDTADTPGADTADCAFDYGWNAARHSYQTAVAAYISLGRADEDATRTPTPVEWWLDVETGNSWRANPSPNVAALQGAVAYLESVDVAGIGFYSTQYQWNQITGGTDVFADYPSWHAGARTLRGAQRNCADEAFTGGELVMTQYLDRGFDANYRCPTTTTG
jgi:hypothetical protein